jgi:hypothetical protein
MNLMEEFKYLHMVGMKLELSNNYPPNLKFQLVASLKQKDDSGLKMFAYISPSSLSNVGEIG